MDRCSVQRHGNGRIEFSTDLTMLVGLTPDSKFYFEMTNWLGKKDVTEFAYTESYNDISINQRNVVMTSITMKEVSPLQTRQPIWIYGNITPGAVYWIRLTNLDTGEMINITSDDTGYFGGLMDNPGAKVGDTIKIEVFLDPDYTNQVYVNPSEKVVTAEDIDNQYIGGPAKDMSTEVAEMKPLVFAPMLFYGALYILVQKRKKQRSEL